MIIYLFFERWLLCIIILILFLCNCIGTALGFVFINTSLFSAVIFFYYTPTSQTSFCEHECYFWGLWRLKLSRGIVIEAKSSQAMVNLKLWLSKNSSSHRHLLGDRQANYQSLACQSPTFALGYHATKHWTLQVA